MKTKILFIMEWTSVLTAFIASYYYGYGSTLAPILGLISCVLFIVVGVDRKLWSLVAVNVGFIVININSWLLFETNGGVVENISVLLK